MQVIGRKNMAGVVPHRKKKKEAKKAKRVKIHWSAEGGDKADLAAIRVRPTEDESRETHSRGEEEKEKGEKKGE